MQSQEMILSTRAGAGIGLSPQWPGNETGPCFPFGSRAFPRDTVHDRGPASQIPITSIRVPPVTAASLLWSPPRAVDDSLGPETTPGSCREPGTSGARDSARGRPTGSLYSCLTASIL